ncbi:MAG TPA: HIT domain-containing protein [Candidatus Caccenecus avistercoris]|nr:HIT domain-containing protein [Candidatus Caccenecus avistercoris]
MDCIFCKIIKGEIPSKVLYEDELVKVIMDVNPTVNGHALIIPKKHYTDYLELDQNIITHIWDVAKKMGPSIMDKLKAKSLTLLVNFGDDQQVKHFHMHLLPNFGTMESKATKTSEEIFSILKD